MDDQPEKFNPKKHLLHLKGKLYLETRWRIAWFRETHPNGVISTEIVSFDPVVVKATVSDGDGGILATAHAGAVDKGNAVWSGRSIEKSETAAIGRALGHAGYGTQFSGVDEDDGNPRNQERNQERNNDRSHERQNSAPPRQQPPRPPQQPPATRTAAPPLEQSLAAQGTPITTPATTVGRAKDDLREMENASRFIQHWRGQGLADAEVLGALGVAKLSLWTKGREAADDAVGNWIQAKLALDDHDAKAS